MISKQIKPKIGIKIALRMLHHNVDYYIIERVTPRMGDKHRCWSYERYTRDVIT